MKKTKTWKTYQNGDELSYGRAIKVCINKIFSNIYCVYTSGVKAARLVRSFLSFIIFLLVLSFSFHPPNLIDAGGRVFPVRVGCLPAAFSSFFSFLSWFFRSFVRSFSFFFLWIKDTVPRCEHAVETGSNDTGNMFFSQTWSVSPADQRRIKEDTRRLTPDIPTSFSRSPVIRDFYNSALLTRSTSWR